MALRPTPGAAGYLTPAGALPTRRELLRQDRTENPELYERLSLGMPADLENTPPTLAFDRVREVELPWPELMQGMAEIGGGAMNPTTALRSHFEESWWGETREAPTPEALAALAAEGSLVVLPEVLPEGEVPTRAFHRHVRVTEDGKGKDTAVPIAEGVILEDAISGRYYLIAIEGETPTLETLTTTEGYQRFWAESAEAAMVVGESAEAALTTQTVYRALDMRAIYIERRYKELRIFEEVAKAIDTKVGGALDGLLELGMGRDLDFAAFEKVQERYVNARLAPDRIKRELLQLKRQADEMDYILFLGDEPDMEITFPDGNKTTAVAGELYRATTRECHWTVWHKKAIVENFFASVGHGIARFFGRPKKKPTKDWPEAKDDTFYDIEKVDTLTDPLAKRTRAYRDKGRQVFVFEETPAGFVTRDGMALTTVMARCQYDERFRQSCVVFLPVYEQGFSIVKPVVSYNIFERPLPGIVPMRMPRLFVDESLSYRTAWKGTELGELVSAINLTPGEDREMTITRSVTREMAETRATTSVIELASSETTDLSSEIERIARVDNEFEVHGESEMRTGGSDRTTNGIRDVADGLTSMLSTVTTGTSSTRHTVGAKDTLKLFSQTMNKVAKKAATSVSRNNRQEITTSTSETTTVSSTDSTVIKLSNINQGRTLNLMFHRVYNRYAAGLFVEDLRFGVTLGTELISGSGIYETRSLRPNRLGAALDLLSNAPLPFDAEGAARLFFQERVLDTLLATLEAEYLEEDGGSNGGGWTLDGEEETGASAAVLAVPQELRAALTAAKTEERAKTAPVVPDAAELAARIAKLERDFAEIRLRSRPLGGDVDGSSDLLVAAPGLYLDSMLGARPATEPYSEEMRAQEVRKQAAEVLQSEAEALYTRAQAARIALQRPGGGGADEGGEETPGNVLTGVYLHRNPTLLTLGLLLPLAAGDWVICDNGRPVEGAEISPDQFHRTSVIYRPRGATRRIPQWLGAPDLMARITLRNRETEDEIRPA